MWHRDFPDDAREMWDVMAKALMMRNGNSTILTAEELRTAAETQAEISLGSDGAIAIRAVTN